MMAEFESKQIYIAHEGIWDAMKAFARNNNFHLDLIPTMVDGKLTLDYPKGETPTYAFMPKMPGDKQR